MRAILLALFVCGVMGANENIESANLEIADSEMSQDADSNEARDLIDSQDSEDSTDSQDSEDSTDSQDSEDSTDSAQSTRNKYPNYEFPSYEDTSFLNSLVHRFAMHEENYFLPVYYSISGIRAPYKRIEAKFQISAKMNIFSNLIWGIGAYFAYTQKSFFQIYSPDISSPFRDNEYIPEVMLYKALNWELWGGKFYNIRFGYKHNSNGVGEGDGDNVERSRGIDRIMAQIMYQNGGFDANLSVTFAYLSKTASSLKDYKKYIGWSDLALSYRFLERNELKLTIKNLFHNYTNYKGSVMLEYKFNFDLFAIYLQYFYGYGDNIYQFNMKSHNIGIGAAVSRF